MKAPRGENQHSVVWDNSRIEFSIDRGDRRRMRLVVSPDGSVEARVPRDTSVESVRDFVFRQRKWVFRQQLYFEHFRPRDPERRYVAGETFRYLGRQYRLQLDDSGPDSVKLKGRLLIVTTKSRNSEEIRGAVQRWYMDRARITFARRSASLFERLAPHGIPARPVGIRRMSRRWGSCTPTGRILINPYLIIAPTDCVDYVLVHEMCHLVHQRHDESFYGLLTTVMTNWPCRRLRLEKCGPHLSL